MVIFIARPEEECKVGYGKQLNALKSIQENLILDKLEMVRHLRRDFARSK